MTPERRESAATRVEQEAVDAANAALDATPRGTPNRVKVLDIITRTFAFELMVARRLRVTA